MKKNYFSIVTKSILVTITLLFSNGVLAQRQKFSPNSQTEFWRNVQFGGGIGLGFGSGFTNITLAPSAIYNLNPIFSAGLGLQVGYAKEKNVYTSSVYGASLIGLINPIPAIQLSVEVEEINASTDYQLIGANLSTNYWNTGLYFGAGYRNGNVTIGGRYDVLYNANKSIYNNAFMPFVRIYF
jgi:long-subunit fatty acid transport protein